MVWLTGQRRPPAGGNELDQRLIQQTQGRRVPSWSQLRYLWQFFSTRERRLFLGALAISGLGAALFIAIFIISHLAARPTSGGEYREALVGQPKYINPLFAAASDIDADLSSLSYAGLFAYGPEQKLVPALAASYTISNDQKIYEVSLRQDIRWSDGEPFTAADVLYTFELIQNNEVGSTLFRAFQGIEVIQINDQTIRFTLRQPFAPFLHSLTVGILPEHIWAGYSPSGLKLAKQNLQPVGAGPWQFDKLVKDEAGTIQSYTLKRNERYFGPRPLLKTITFKFYPDYTQAIEAIRGGGVDALSFAPRQAQSKLSGKNLRSYNLILPQYVALFFNAPRQPLLKNDAFRRALALATNKKTIVQEALAGNGRIIDSPILEGAVGYYPDVKKIAFDLDQANALLDKEWTRVQPEEYFSLRRAELLKIYQGELENLKKASSTPEQIKAVEDRIARETSEGIRSGMNAEQTFYRKDKNNKIISLVIATNDNGEYQSVARAISQQWAKAGIFTEVRTISIREARKSRNYDLLLFGELAGSDPDPFPFWHSSQIDYPGLNLALYANRNADKILEDGRTATDESKRTELYKKFQDLLANDLPAIFLYTPIHNFVVNKEIKGISINHLASPANRFDTLGNWYKKTAWSWQK